MSKNDLNEPTPTVKYNKQLIDNWVNFVALYIMQTMTMELSSCLTLY